MAMAKATATNEPMGQGSGAHWARPLPLSKMPRTIRRKWVSGYGLNLCFPALCASKSRPDSIAGGRMSYGDVSAEMWNQSCYLEPVPKAGGQCPRGCGRAGLQVWLTDPAQIG